MTINVNGELVRYWFGIFQVIFLQGFIFGATTI